MTYTEAEWELANRHESMRENCDPTFLDTFPSMLCPDCQGKGYVPNVTTDAMEDVLFSASWFLDIHRFDAVNQWGVEGDTLSGVLGEGPTKRDAMIAACLNLPVEAK